MPLSAWLDQLSSRQQRHWCTASRPWVTAAFATSVEGYLSEARGRRTMLSGPESMVVTHQLRSLHDGILVGIGTVLTDNPMLTTRLVPGENPRRIVLDSHLRTPLDARLLSADAQPALVLGSTRASAERARALRRAGAEVVLLSLHDHGLSLPALLSLLVELGIRSLMVEGGARVLSSFFSHGLVDDVCLTEAPVRLADAADIIEPVALDEPFLNSWQPQYCQRYGNDWVKAGPIQSISSFKESSASP